MGHQHALDIRRDDQDLLLGGIGLFGRDIALQVHEIQHDLLPALGLFRGIDRVQRGAVADRDQHSRLGQAQLRDRFAKVSLGCGLDPKGHVAVGNVVEVPLQNLVPPLHAGILPRQLDGQNDLFDLANLATVHPLIERHEDVANQLLSDRATPTRILTRDLTPHRTSDASPVHATPVGHIVVKGLVLRGDGGISQVLGDIAQRYIGAPARIWRDDFVQQDLAGAIVQPGRLKRLGAT